MIVDSYRFLPRSFVAMYDSAEPAPEDRDPVWAPFEKRLAQATIALVTSSGLYVEGEQPPFDLDRERREPTWGDPTYRAIPHGLDRPLGVNHLHINTTDVEADHNVALPMDALDELAAAGRVGAAAPHHVSVMGYQAAGLEGWRSETAPAMIELFRSEGVDGVVLAPV